MASTFKSLAALQSDPSLARNITAELLHHGTWPEDQLDELLRRATSADVTAALQASRIFFREVVEKICDLFDPQLALPYADLFAGLVARVLPGYSAESLKERYRRVRCVQSYAGNPKRVCVLSRITLGADVVVSSAMLAAAKRRFPDAEICFVGPAKNAELFAADTAVTRIATQYGRSASLRDRLLASEAIRPLIEDERTLVIDPDSRFTQLGVIPLADEQHYLFFESRAYGGTANATLAALASDWISRTLGMENARPYLMPPVDETNQADVAISLGVGENREKLVNDELEFQAVRALASLGRRVLIDVGGGGEEQVRAQQIVSRLGFPAHVQLHEGSFASFANAIMQSRLYFGYDSAGQHVAAASGIPLVTVFAGYAAERTFERWHPSGPGPMRVVKIADRNAPENLERTLAAITSAAAEAGLS